MASIDKEGLLSLYVEAYKLDQGGKTPAAARMCIDIARCAMAEKGLDMEGIEMVEQTVIDKLGVDRQENNSDR